MSGNRGIGGMRRRTGWRARFSVAVAVLFVVSLVLGVRVVSAHSATHSADAGGVIKIGITADDQGPFAVPGADSFRGAKMALVVARSDQSDIYVGSLGTPLQRVTSGGLNSHPAFGPNGELVYVSDRAGNPQVYVDGRRVTTRGSYNMAPSWCADPAGAKIVFMGRDGATWDIFTVDPSGDPQSMQRLTQDQGSNTYPACSPDGRMIAFFSSRGGLYTMTTQGSNQQKVAGIMGESLRWEGN